MYDTLPSLFPPKSNVVIWRYLDFTKFVDLIDTRKLFFCRLDNFEDTHEGFIPFPAYKGDKALFDKGQMVRKQYYVNCWHVNDFESAAMWRLYSKDNNGVAIQSTFYRLRESIENAPERICISDVRYVDFNKEVLSGQSIVNIAVYKRRSFSHENELRAIYIREPVTIDKEKFSKLNHESGKKIDVNVERMIERLYVSPYAEKWFKDLVKSVALKYNLTVDVVQSSLFDTPRLV